MQSAHRHLETFTQSIDSHLQHLLLVRLLSQFSGEVVPNQPLLNDEFLALKQKVEQQISVAQSNLIHPADDDLLQLAETDFLHTTYRTRDQNNQRQRIELYLAPINHQLITITVRIGDDVDMQSYNELQTFLTQKVAQVNMKVKST